MLWFSLVASASATTGPTVDAQVVLQAVAQTEDARAHRALAAPGITAKDYGKVATGEVVTGLERVDGSGARRAWGVALIDAPIDTVWSAVNDFSNHTELTKVSYSELQRGQDCQSGRAVFQYLPVGVPMVSDRYWVTVLTATPAVNKASGGRLRELAAVADMRPQALVTAKARELAAQGTPISFSEGGWLLTAVDDGHTLAEFTVWSDPGGYVPANIASSFATGGVADNMDSLRKLVARGPGCQGL